MAASPARRYRLDAIAPNVEEVVTGLGKWMFDRALAGWDVRVLAGWDVRALVCGCVDDHALRILGAVCASFDEVLSAEYWSAPTKVVAVSMAALESEAGPPGWFADAMGGGVSDLYLWGSDSPSDLTCQTRVEPTEHSRASRVFHQYAVSALTRRGSPVTQAKLFRVLRAQASTPGPACRDEPLPDALATSEPKHCPT